MDLTKGQTAASEAAKRAVEAVQPWTIALELRFRVNRLFRNRRRRLVAQNDRAARRLGYVPNAVVMTLPYNTVTESSQDARSLEQRSVSDASTLYVDGSDGSQLRKELQILPPLLWSMGKSFYANKGANNDDEDSSKAESSRLYFLKKEKEWIDQRDGEFYCRHVRHDLSSGLIAWSLPLPFILGAQSGRWRMDKFLALAYFLGCPVIDRTETLNRQVGLKLVNLHPIPKRNPNFNMKLETIMIARANEAIESCRARKNKEIHVLWSGGIDTTAVVCAFLRATTEHYRDLIVIRYTERSAEEYPAFFHDFIKPLLRHELILGHIRDVFTVQDGLTDETLLPIVVTGDPADMLFGTFRMAGALDGSYSLNEPWEKRAPLLIHERRLLMNATDYFNIKTKTMRVISKHKVKHVAEEWVRWMRPQVRKSPIPIRTMFDWWWWITYSCKYNHDVHRIFYNRREPITPELRARVFNFYQSDNFHQHSFAAHAKKMEDKRVWASYKHPLKFFILGFCRGSPASGPPRSPRPIPPRSPRLVDDHTVYFFSKIKVPSVANSFGMEVGLDSNWEVVRFGAASISLKALALEHGNRLHDAFLTDKAKIKREGDSFWANGKWNEALSAYKKATAEIDCQEDIQSCQNALRRIEKGKEPKFQADENMLERHQMRGLISTKTWDDGDKYFSSAAWSFYGGAIGGE